MKEKERREGWRETERDDDMKRERKNKGEGEGEREAILCILQSPLDYLYYLICQ